MKWCILLISLQVTIKIVDFRIISKLHFVFYLETFALSIETIHLEHIVASQWLHWLLNVVLNNLLWTLFSFWASKSHWSQEKTLEKNGKTALENAGFFNFWRCMCTNPGITVKLHYVAPQRQLSQGCTR